MKNLSYSNVSSTPRVSSLLLTIEKIEREKFRFCVFYTFYIFSFYLFSFFSLTHNSKTVGPNHCSSIRDFCCCSTHLAVFSYMPFVCGYIDNLNTKTPITMLYLSIDFSKIGDICFLGLSCLKVMIRKVWIQTCNATPFPYYILYVLTC